MVDRRAQLAALGLILAVSLSACAGPGPAVSTSPLPAPSPLRSGPTIAPTGSLVIEVARDDQGGRYLSVGGHALYTRSTDPPAGSGCLVSDGCASIWPPLIVKPGIELIGSGAGGAFTAYARPDGSGDQVVYRGQALYAYSGDSDSDPISGDGVDGVWSLAIP